MTASPTIDLAEMVAILRDHLADKLGCAIDEITVTSFDKPRIVISEDGMVDCSEFRHRVKG